jgi:hypothetical protein
MRGPDRHGRPSAERLATDPEAAPRSDARPVVDQPAHRHGPELDQRRQLLGKVRAQPSRAGGPRGGRPGASRRERRRSSGRRRATVHGRGRHGGADPRRPHRARRRPVERRTCVLACIAGDPIQSLSYRLSVPSPDEEPPARRSGVRRQYATTWSHWTALRQGYFGRTLVHPSGLDADRCTGSPNYSS